MGEVMKKLRAMYTGDVRFNECPVFELNEDNGYFEMISDHEFRYEKSTVFEDNDFIIFSIEDDTVRIIKATYN